MTASARGRPGRDSAKQLSRELILDEALAMIDEAGIDGFSVRALAEKMGVYPGAVYWYLPTRNALFAAVVNHALRDVSPEADPDDWKAWLRDLFHCHRNVIRRHPAIAPLISSQMLSNTGANIELIERLLDVLSRAGFKGEKLYAAYDIVISTTVGFVTMEFSSKPSNEHDDWASDIQKMIADIDEDAHPVLHRHKDALANRHFVLRWENGEQRPMDASFEAYVYTVIEGLRQLLTR